MVCYHRYLNYLFLILKDGAHHFLNNSIARNSSDFWKILENVSDSGDAVLNFDCS